MFIDLRDREGITQIVFDPEIDVTAHEAAGALRSEWVLGVIGKVRSRGSNVNDKIATGAIEIAAIDRPRLGQYPDPIVDFKVTSKAMKDQIFSIRKSDAGKQASAEVLEKYGSRKRPSRARR